MIHVKNNNISSLITLGFALFAMFFGAGNLILPPFIGLQSSSEWFYAIIGFVTTGIIAPLISLIAVVQVGNNFTDIGKRVNQPMITTLTFIIIWLIGPLIGIPRTGATTFEIGIQPVFPKVTSSMSALLFFGTTAFLTISPSKIVDIIGKYLTPILILLLLTLIIIGILYTSDMPAISNLTPIESFSLGFNEGYQTMDVLSAVIFAGIITNTIAEKGFDQIKTRVSMTIISGIIAAVCLLIIYGGLVYLGAVLGYPVTHNVSRTKLLLHISHTVLGGYGSYIISIAIALACLTTAIAVTSAFSSFMEKISKGKLSYKLNVIICSFLAGIFSIKSVDDIINYAGIFLNLVYPIVFSLVIHLVFFGKFIKSRTPYVSAVVITTIISSLSVLEYYKIFPNFIDSLKNKLPLVQHNLEWIIPSFIAFIITTLLSAVKKKKRLSEF